MSFRSRLIGGAMAAAVAIVGTWEGLRTTAYRDPIGIPTVCYGETRSVRMGDKYSAKECKIMLGKRLVEFEMRMRKCLKHPDRIPEKSYVAFLSLTYNVGAGAFCRGSVARYANQRDYVEACRSLKKYVYAGGKRLRGLVNRRNAEYKLCMEGVRGI